MNSGGVSAENPVSVPTLARCELSGAGVSVGGGDRGRSRPSPRRTVSPVRRGGFTIIEVLVVAALGSMVLAMAYGVLTLQQRIYTGATAQLDGLNTLRAGLEIMFVELREASPNNDDIISIADTSISIRVSRSFGLVCGADYSAPSLTLRKVGSWFEVGDSIVVMADNDVKSNQDDVWMTATITAVTRSGTCSGSDTAQVVRLSGISFGSPPDSVVSGAPVRALTPFTYGLFLIDGEHYVGRQQGSADPVPLAGPVASSRGLSLEYYDDSGAVTTDLTEIARIRVRIRTLSGALDVLGKSIADSVVTDIMLRN